MALPYRRGAGRMAPVWRTFLLEDPSFDAPVAIALRPVLDVEVDAVDEATASFVAKHIDGGWIDDSGALQKAPLPIFIDGQPAPVAETTARLMHRYAAMQRALGSSVPPAFHESPLTDEERGRGEDPSRTPVTVVDVPDLVEAAFRADGFWKAFQAVAGAVWRDGQAGKAWAAPGSSPPPSA